CAMIFKSLPFPARAEARSLVAFLLDRSLHEPLPTALLPQLRRLHPRSGTGNSASVVLCVPASVPQAPFHQSAQDAEILPQCPLLGTLAPLHRHLWCIAYDLAL